MSYSRWLTSYWYTFWQAPLNKEEENRDTALFCICTLIGNDMVFTSKELRENRAECLKAVAKQDPQATIVDLGELSIYMDQFIEDVNSSYPKTITN